MVSQKRRVCSTAGTRKGSGKGHGYAVLSEIAALLESDAGLGNLHGLQAELEVLRALLTRIRVGRPD